MTFNNLSCWLNFGINLIESFKIKQMENQLKIFLVDDDLFYLNILEQHLHNLGYKDVVIYTNGTDCINNLEQNPTVIFLDYKMDTLSGYEVLKKIKRYNPNIYTVMISGQEEIKPAIDSLKHGAFDYIQKGDDMGEKLGVVLSRIEEVIDLLKREKPSFLKSLFKYT